MAEIDPMISQSRTQPAAPFVWGGNGRRMTADDIMRERALAARQMQSDYSPIQSPWQGLARVADQWMGSMRDRAARKASEENAVDSATIAELLANPEMAAPSQDSGILPVNAPPSPAASDAGLLVPGNLPRNVTQQVQNPDGSVSTVRSMSFGTDQGEVLVPTVIDGKVVSDDEAIKHYYDTGQHLGIFATPDAATAYAQGLHNRHAQELGLPADGLPPISDAPPPPADWRQAVNVDPVAASLVDQTDAENQIARALAARPQPANVVAPMYHPREAIIQALTNPYVDQNVRTVADRMWQQEYEQAKPQFFMSNDDRVVYNPATGESEMLYDAPEDFQLYADQQGLEPGSDEYNDAMADYVLRTAGPTANAGRQGLENLRQQNRLGMEDVRQKNRMQLRSTPTYSQANPRPTAGRGGGGARPGTLAGVIAPILAKVARGQALSVGEQRALDTYYRRNGGSSSKGAARSGSTGGQVIRNPKTGERMVNRDGKWVPMK